LRVIHVGIKNWPFDSAFKQKDTRGGGSNKYCDILLNAFQKDVESYIITRLAPNQAKYEIKNNFRIYRIKTFGGRALRQILVNFLSSILIIRIARKEKIDLIHGHMLVGILFAFILGKIVRLPVIGTPYSIVTKEFRFPFNKIANALERFFYPKISKLVFESEQNREEANKHLGIKMTDRQDRFGETKVLKLPNHDLQNR